MDLGVMHIVMLSKNKQIDTDICNTFQLRKMLCLELRVIQSYAATNLCDKRNMEDIPSDRKETLPAHGINTLGPGRRR